MAFKRTSGGVRSRLALRTRRAKGTTRPASCRVIAQHRCQVEVGEFAKEPAPLPEPGRGRPRKEQAEAQEPKRPRGRPRKEQGLGRGRKP
jgi:hypothetical protein